MKRLKEKAKDFLKWSQKYTRTDMLYVAKGGSWWILGKSCILFCSFILLMAFSRWVPKETYGAYRYILSMVVILNIFSLPGMGPALVRAVARGKDKMLKICATAKFKWALLGSGVSLGISGWYFFHHNLVLGSCFLIAAFFIPLTTTFQLFLYFWQGRKRFDLQAKYSALAEFLAVGGLIFVIFLTDNLILIIGSYFAFYALFRGLFFKITLKQVQNQETEPSTIPFGKHLTLMQGAKLFGKQIDKVIIWQILGPVPVALYSFAQLPILRIKQLIPISSLALPKLSTKNIKQNKKELIKKTFKLFLISIPLTLILILIAPLVYRIFFPQYLDSVPYFQVLALIIMFSPFLLLETSLVAGMRKGELYVIRFANPLLKVILILALASIYGIWGIVWSVLGIEIFCGILTLIFFLRI